MSDESRLAGLLLAAGAGRRMGLAKALVRTASGEPWVVRGARLLLESGCSPIVVVIGAQADEVAPLLAETFPAEPRLIVHRAGRWSEGMSASLRAGLGVLSAGDIDAGGVDAAIVTLVDTPTLRAETIARIRAAGMVDAAPNALVQATFDGRPGHPVLLGRFHWPALIADLRGDSGARSYLRSHDTHHVECGDLESGEDLDTPPS